MLSTDKRYHQVKAYDDLLRMRPAVTILSLAVLLYTLLHILVTSQTSLFISAAFLIYTCINLILLFTHMKRDVFSPVGAMVIFVFLGYGEAVAVFVNDSTVGALTTSHRYLESSLILIITTSIAFVIGFDFRRSLPGYLSKPLCKTARTTISISTILGVYSFILISFYARYLLRLGVAGETSVTPFSGVLQYIFYDWANLAAVYLLVMALRQRKRIWILWGLGGLCLIALTQSVLGWRGGIVNCLLMALVVFWYQRPVQMRGRLSGGRSINWLWLLIAIGGVLIPLGNRFRINRIGGEEFLGLTDMLQKIWLRGFGLPRLLRILEFDGQLLIWNDRGVDLWNSGITSFKYADWKVWGLGIGVADGRGASGIGSPYLCFGVIGVILAFAAFGYFSRIVYQLLISNYWREGGIWITVFYARLMTQYQFCFIEVFSILLLLKWVLANLVGVLVLKCAFDFNPLKARKNICLLVPRVRE